MIRLTNEEIIQNIKDCGQALIDNAEKIACGYTYLQDIAITCYVTEQDCAPYIHIDTEIIPEKFLGRYKE